jgi:hypothetical protein
MTTQPFTHQLDDTYFLPLGKKCDNPTKTKECQVYHSLSPHKDGLPIILMDDTYMALVGLQLIVRRSDKDAKTTVGQALMLKRPKLIYKNKNAALSAATSAASATPSATASATSRAQSMVSTIERNVTYHGLIDTEGQGVGFVLTNFTNEEIRVSLQNVKGQGRLNRINLLRPYQTFVVSTDATEDEKLMYLDSIMEKDPQTGKETPLTVEKDMEKGPPNAQAKSFQVIVDVAETSQFKEKLKTATWQPSPMFVVEFPKPIKEPALQTLMMAENVSTGALANLKPQKKSINKPKVEWFTETSGEEKQKKKEKKKIAAAAAGRDPIRKKRVADIPVVTPLSATPFAFHVGVNSNNNTASAAAPSAESFGGFCGFAASSEPHIIDESHAGKLRYGEVQTIKSFDVEFLPDPYSQHRGLRLFLAVCPAIKSMAKFNMKEATIANAETYMACYLTKSYDNFWLAFKNKKPYYANECVICLEDKPDTVMVNCGHTCVHAKCFVKNNESCPVCRAPLISMLTVSQLPQL